MERLTEHVLELLIMAVPHADLPAVRLTCRRLKQSVDAMNDPDVEANWSRMVIENRVTIRRDMIRRLVSGGKLNVWREWLYDDMKHPRTLRM